MVTDEKREVLRWFSEGRKAYLAKHFERARDCFASALQIDQDDGPSKVYYFRCKHYLENPPPDDWDGVFIMKTK